MNKKIIYFSLAVLLILGGGLLFFSGGKHQQDNPTPDQSTAESTDQEVDTSDSTTFGESVSTEGDVASTNKTVVYFFWGDGCPHCEVQKPFLEDMEQKYPELEVKMYETWKDKDNAELFQEMAAAYGIQARGVPTTFIGDLNPIVGFTESMKSDMENKIKNCIEQDCIDPASKL